MLLNNTKFENLVSANIGSRPHSMTNVPPLFSTDSPHNNKRVLSSNTTFLVQENACLSVKAASAPRPMAPTAVPMVRACCHTDSAGSCPLLYLSLRFLRASANSIKPSCGWVDGQVCAHVCVCGRGRGGGEVGIKFIDSKVWVKITGKKENELLKCGGTQRLRAHSIPCNHLNNH